MPTPTSYPLSLESVPLPWYGKTAVELEIRHAAAIAGNLLQRSIELRRAKPRRELVFDLDDEI